MDTILFTERLQQIPTLAAGGHQPDDNAMCVMEAVAFVAGEPWSDHPLCACPVIGAFMRAWNDGLPDDERDTLLRPYIARLVGTRSTKAVQQRRSDLALDWMVRVHAPVWLDLSEALSPHAPAMRALPALHSKKARESATPVLAAAAQGAAAARAAAWDAARDAAWDAARDAASDAAWDAARDAAWDAARDAAWDAARDAARDAAWDAARDAAWDAASDAASDAAMAAAWAAAWAAASDAARAAAWAAVQKIDISSLTPGQAADAARSACVALFAPTRATLQRHALELLDAMLAVTPESLASEGQ